MFYGNIIQHVFERYGTDDCCCEIWFVKFYLPRVVSGSIQDTDEFRNGWH
jgi:hypothetical protein